MAGSLEAPPVRGAVEHAVLPTKGFIEEVGDMMLLTGKTILSALLASLSLWGEFVSQFLFTLRLCWAAATDLHGLHLLRGTGPAGRELPRS